MASQALYRPSSLDSASFVCLSFRGPLLNMHEPEVHRLVLRPMSWRVSRLEQSICRKSPSVGQEVERECREPPGRYSVCCEVPALRAYSLESLMISCFHAG